MPSYCSSRFGVFTILTSLLFCSLFSSAQAADTAIVQWNERALQAIRDTHPGPPVVARMLAITHTCMCDAWAAYDDHAAGTRLGGTLRVPRSERTEPNQK